MFLQISLGIKQIKAKVYVSVDFCLAGIYKYLIVCIKLASVLLFQTSTKLF